MFVYLSVSETQCIIYRPGFYNSQTNRKRLNKQLMVKTKLSINAKTKNTSKHDYCKSFLTSEIQGFPQSEGGGRVCNSGWGVGGFGVQGRMSALPTMQPNVFGSLHVMGCPPTRLSSLYIKVCSPHHLSESPYQWVSPSQPKVCGEVSCTKSLTCPLRNKFFAILYKIIGKLPLSAYLINLILGTPSFTL